MAASSPSPVESRASRIRERAHAIFRGDRVGEFIERTLFGGEHHGLDIAERDFLFFAHVEDELLKFVRDHHHVAAERVDQFAGAVGIDLDVARGAVFADPAHRFAFLDARQFDNAAERAEVFADLLITILVGHLHAADVGRNADVIGDEDEQRVGIGIFAVLFDGADFFLVRAAAEKRLSRRARKTPEKAP